MVGALDLAAGEELTGQLAYLGATSSYGSALVHLRRFVAGRGLLALTIAMSQVTPAAVTMQAATPVVTEGAPVLTAVSSRPIPLWGAVGTRSAYAWNTATVDR